MDLVSRVSFDFLLRLKSSYFSTDLKAEDWIGFLLRPFIKMELPLNASSLSTTLRGKAGIEKIFKGQFSDNHPIYPLSQPVSSKR